MHRPVDHYGPLTIGLHWLTAALIFAVLVLGFVMTRRFIGAGLRFELFQWHKSFGMLALLLSVLRALHSIWRVRMSPVPGISLLEHRIARSVHSLLLALALAVPLAGWFVASASPLEIPTFAFNAVVIPHLPVSKSDAAEAWWTTIHAVAAYTLLGLVLAHSMAALHHHYRRRDAVLMRMLGSRALLKAGFREHRQ